MADAPENGRPTQTTDLTLENFCVSKSVGNVRNNFAQVIDEVQFHKNKILITEHGRPSAVIMPVEAARAVGLFDKLGITEKMANMNYTITTKEQLIELINELQEEEKEHGRKKSRAKGKHYSSSPP